MPTITGVRLRYTDAARTYADVAVTENGTEIVCEAMPTADANELVQTLSARHNVSVQYEDENGKGIAVSVPEDVRYVSADAAIYLVQHRTYDTFLAAFSRTEALRICANERRDAREADADADGYYVTHETCQTLDVPDCVRLLGRDAVLAYVHGG